MKGMPILMLADCPPATKGDVAKESDVNSMQEESTRRLYDDQAKIYDFTFGGLVLNRLDRAISEHMHLRPTDRVLDLGVGTGNSLRYYPEGVRVFGVDLSAGMLAKCVGKIKASGRTTHHICQADALHLPFADNSFDHVFISHVISVVSDPVRLMAESQRVAKLAGRVVIVNHFQSTNRAMALLEKVLCPLCTKLGWRSDLGFADLIRRTGLEIDYRYKHNPIDFWETVVMTNNKSMLAM
jgi:phosphatidylethanolamine/phosphatidyl-N-methylethanolamine N-methyltransferase